MPVASKAVPSVIASSVCWSLQCLVSALTQRGRWRTLFFFFRLTCSVALWGGRDAANNTGVYSQCLSHTGPDLAHGACALLARTAQALCCWRWELSEAGPGLHAPSRSKLLRFRHSGSPERHRLRWACVLCPSKLRAARVMMCLVSVVTATYGLSRPCHSVFWMYNWHTFSGG